MGTTYSDTITNENVVEDIEEIKKENKELRDDINKLEKHIVNLHFLLLDLDVDCKYGDIKIE
jgi:hypothetical protein